VWHLRRRGGMDPRQIHLHDERDLRRAASDIQAIRQLAVENDGFDRESRSLRRFHSSLRTQNHLLHSVGRRSADQAAISTFKEAWGAEGEASATDALGITGEAMASAVAASERDGDDDEAPVSATRAAPRRGPVSESRAKHLELIGRARDYRRLAPIARCFRAWTNMVRKRNEARYLLTKVFMVAVDVSTWNASKSANARIVQLHLAESSRRYRLEKLKWGFRNLVHARKLQLARHIKSRGVYVAKHRPAEPGKHAWKAFCRGVGAIRRSRIVDSTTYPRMLQRRLLLRWRDWQDAFREQRRLSRTERLREWAQVYRQGMADRKRQRHLHEQASAHARRALLLKMTRYWQEFTRQSLDFKRKWKLAEWFDALKTQKRHLWAWNDLILRRKSMLLLIITHTTRRLKRFGVRRWKRGSDLVWKLTHQEYMWRVHSKHAAIAIQSWWRMLGPRYRFRKRLLEVRAATVRIQTMMRGFLGRKAFRLAILGRDMRAFWVIQNERDGMKDAAGEAELFEFWFRMAGKITRFYLAYRARYRRWEGQVAEEKLRRMQHKADQRAAALEEVVHRAQVAHDNETRRAASTVIQSAWRRYMELNVICTLKKLRMLYNRATVMQRQFRNHRTRALISGARRVSKERVKRIASDRRVGWLLGWLCCASSRQQHREVHSKLDRWWGLRLDDVVLSIPQLLQEVVDDWIIGARDVAASVAVARSWFSGKDGRADARFRRNAIVYPSFSVGQGVKVCHPHNMALGLTGRVLNVLRRTHDAGRLTVRVDQTGAMVNLPLSLDPLPFLDTEFAAYPLNPRLGLLGLDNALKQRWSSAGSETGKWLAGTMAEERRHLSRLTECLKLEASPDTIEEILAAGPSDSMIDAPLALVQKVRQACRSDEIKEGAVLSLKEWVAQQKQENAVKKVQSRYRGWKARKALPAKRKTVYKKRGSRVHRSSGLPVGHDSGVTVGLPLILEEKRRAMQLYQILKRRQDSAADEESPPPTRVPLCVRVTRRLGCVSLGDALYALWARGMFSQRVNAEYRHLLRVRSKWVRDVVVAQRLFSGQESEVVLLGRLHRERQLVAMASGMPQSKPMKEKPETHDLFSPMEEDSKALDADAVLEEEEEQPPPETPREDDAAPVPVPHGRLLDTSCRRFESFQAGLAGQSASAEHFALLPLAAQCTKLAISSKMNSNMLKPAMLSIRGSSFASTEDDLAAVVAARDGVERHGRLAKVLDVSTPEAALTGRRLRELDMHALDQQSEAPRLREQLRDLAKRHFQDANPAMMPPSTQERVDISNSSYADWDFASFEYGPGSFVGAGVLTRKPSDDAIEAPRVVFLRWRERTFWTACWFQLWTFFRWVLFAPWGLCCSCTRSNQRGLHRADTPSFGHAATTLSRHRILHGARSPLELMSMKHKELRVTCIQRWIGGYDWSMRSQVEHRTWVGLYQFRDIGLSVHCMMGGFALYHGEWGDSGAERGHPHGRGIAVFLSGHPRFSSKNGMTQEDVRKQDALFHEIVDGVANDRQSVFGMDPNVAVVLQAHLDAETTGGHLPGAAWSKVRELVEALEAGTTAERRLIDQANYQAKLNNFHVIKPQHGDVADREKMLMVTMGGQEEDVAVREARAQREQWVRLRDRARRNRVAEAWSLAESRLIDRIRADINLGLRSDTTALALGTPSGWGPSGLASTASERRYSQIEGEFRYGFLGGMVWILYTDGSEYWGPYVHDYPAPAPAEESIPGVSELLAWANYSQGELLRSLVRQYSTALPSEFLTFLSDDARPSTTMPSPVAEASRVEVQAGNVRLAEGVPRQRLPWIGRPNPPRRALAWDHWGVFQDSNGWVYQGPEVDNHFSAATHSGFVVVLSPKGLQYEGYMYHGQWHGRGAMRFEDGSSYRGFWHEGKPTGVGQFVRTNGEICTGQFADGELHGLGIKYIPGTRTEIGQFQHGKRHGLCIVRGVPVRAEPLWGISLPEDLQGCSIREYTVAQFSEGRAHGPALEVSRDGAVFCGANVRGYRSGHGILSHANGERFDGHFAEGMPHGRGVWSKPFSGDPAFLTAWKKAAASVSPNDRRAEERRAGERRAQSARKQRPKVNRRERRPSLPELDSLGNESQTERDAELSRPGITLFAKQCIEAFFKGDVNGAMLKLQLTCQTAIEQSLEGYSAERADMEIRQPGRWDQGKLIHRERAFVSRMATQAFLTLFPLSVPIPSEEELNRKFRAQYERMAARAEIDKPFGIRQDAAEELDEAWKGLAIDREAPEAVDLAVGREETEFDHSMFVWRGPMAVTIASRLPAVPPGVDEGNPLVREVCQRLADCNRSCAGIEGLRITRAELHEKHEARKQAEREVELITKEAADVFARAASVRAIIDEAQSAYNKAKAEEHKMHKSIEEYWRAHRSVARGKYMAALADLRGVHVVDWEDFRAERQPFVRDRRLLGTVSRAVSILVQEPHRHSWERVQWWCTPGSSLEELDEPDDLGRVRLLIGVERGIVCPYEFSQNPTNIMDLARLLQRNPEFDPDGDFVVKQNPAVIAIVKFTKAFLQFAQEAFDCYKLHAEKKRLRLCVESAAAQLQAVKSREDDIESLSLTWRQRLNHATATESFMRREMERLIVACIEARKVVIEWAGSDGLQSIEEGLPHPEWELLPPIEQGVEGKLASYVPPVRPAQATELVDEMVEMRRQAEVAAYEQAWTLIENEDGTSYWWNSLSDEWYWQNEHPTAVEEDPDAKLKARVVDLKKKLVMMARTTAQAAACAPKEPRLPAEEPIKPSDFFPPLTADISAGGRYEFAPTN
jgi:hypothetical protein